MLFLGSSETIGEFGKLFAVVDRKAKIYQRKAGDYGHQRAGFARMSSRLPETDVVQQKGITLSETRLPLQEIATRTLLAHYSPVGALVDEHGNILFLLGRTGRYLEPAPGEASMNIFRMAREGLRGDLTIALHRAVSTGTKTRHSGLRVKSDGSATTVDLTVLPVSMDMEGLLPHGLFLVILEAVFEEDHKVSARDALDLVDDALALVPDLDGYIFRLKEELRAKDEYLQAAVEELETSNEELRSAHEEMQSVNEEMQSTNEELETSKEELQSVNEELATVNNELQAKVSDLSRSNNDMKNLLSGTGIGTVFVDCLLRILRFTPTVSVLINLIETDVGRPLDQIRSNLTGYDQLAADVKEVLDTLVPKELEVQTKTGEWFLLRVRPYRTLDNVIEGAVITFTEISVVKQAQAALRDTEGLRRLVVVVRDSRDAILVQDLSGRILAWNPGAERMYGWSETEALTMNVRDLMPETGREDALASVRQLCQLGTLEPQRVQRRAKDGRTLTVSLIAAPLVDKAGGTYAIATTERDVTG